VMIPNTTVRFRYGLIAGIIAGTTYQILQWAYIYFQSALSQYGAIYGSFAALPLFLIWLQGSWLVVLAGAELAYYSENRRAEAFFEGLDRLSFAAKKEVSHSIVKEISTAFKSRLPPPTVVQLSEKLHLPLDLIQQLLDILVEEKLLVEVHSTAVSNYAYQPAMDPDLLSHQKIDEAMDHYGISLPSKE
jgi:membrane protein